MNSRTTKQFRELFQRLPSHIRKQSKVAYLLFEFNPYHPGLHFKRVHPEPPIYSVRVGIGYRALGIVDGDCIVWYWIGSHADYDKLLAQI